MDARGTHVPKLPLVPEKITLKVVRKKMTTWKLYLELNEFAEDNSEEVKDLLQITRNWAMAAACKGSLPETTIHMAYFLLTVTLPSKDVKQEMRPQLDRALVPQIQAPPQLPPPPTFNGQSAAHLTAAALQAMMPEQQKSSDALAGVMEKGFDSALHIFQQNMSDSHYKRFTEIQKGAIMGFCGVTSWKDVPGIWKYI